MIETYAYRGHSIDLHLDELYGSFRWTYFIDEKYCCQTKHSLDAVDRARAEALAQAYQSIDRLVALPGGPGAQRNARRAERATVEQEA